eukprot:GHUV01040686.1.p1 GENE.GHUV01040686.1~~GHUV01040686.1.p1  ORF type:complete len:100 (+),score=15.35 GHUV01040686.1:369-668(+)
MRLEHAYYTANRLRKVSHGSFQPGWIPDAQHRPQAECPRVAAPTHVSNSSMHGCLIIHMLHDLSSNDFHPCISSNSMGSTPAVNPAASARLHGHSRLVI